jgi:hypothetical protein
VILAVIEILLKYRRFSIPRTLINQRPPHSLIVMSKPHSKTVRGTLDNPKTQAAIKSSDSNPPQLGDQVSLKPETDNPPTPENQKAKATSSLVSNSASDTNDNDLPHSQKVRGTLANSDGKRVNKTQLGDPASLKAETSKTDLGRQTEREGKEKSKL